MQTYEKLLTEIYQKSPFQKKALESYLKSQPDDFFIFFNDTLENYLHAFAEQNVDITQIATSYLEMCQDTLMEQIKFSKTGKYSLSNFHEASQNVYFNSKKMTPYMLGLMSSIFLWDNHQLMFQFFLKHIEKNKSKINTYLEVGAGHGLFLTNAIKKLGNINYEVVDISNTSIEISKKITQYHTTNQKIDIKFNHLDFLEYKESNKKDFIVMGEVLEHVENPEIFLKKIHSLLNPKGFSYITTCSNCPAIDHIYLFNNVAEIRKLIKDCQFKIIDELTLEAPTVANKPNLIGHNYAAIIQHI